MNVSMQPSILKASVLSYSELSPAQVLTGTVREPRRVLSVVSVSHLPAMFSWVRAADRHDRQLWRACQPWPRHQRRGDCAPHQRQRIQPQEGSTSVAP